MSYNKFLSLLPMVRRSSHVYRVYLCSVLSHQQWREHSLVITMFVLLSLILALLGHSNSHSMYSGQCPDFPPMSGFDWNKVSRASLKVSHQDVLVLHRPVVRHREVQHQVNLPHLRVQDGQSRLQVRRAGRVLSVDWRVGRYNLFLFRLTRSPTPASLASTIITCN